MTYWLAEGISLTESENGSFLVGSQPLRMVRLNKPLLNLIQRMEEGTVAPTNAAEGKVLESLLKGGFVERSWPKLDELPQLPLVSVIIPVRNRPDDLRKCLTSLDRLDYPRERLELIVVDDGSTDATPEVARELGAELVPSGAVGGGPALARNRGAGVARGEILAFIDSDCSATEEWLSDLLPAFSEETLAAVGGWVDGMHQGSALDRYEAVMSSLNLGRRELSGGVGGDTFYLPSCNLLIRKKAFAAAGGFNTDLQVGEDVDLTWRLRDAGWIIRYLPAGSVCHAHRSRPWPFMTRRFDYGTSEGLLQQLHPVRGKKMLMPPMLTAILLLLISGLLFRAWWAPTLGTALWLLDSCLSWKRMKKHQLPVALRPVAGARLRAVWSLAYYLGYHLLRYYLLPLLLLSALFPPLGLVLAAIFFAVGLVDFRVKQARLLLPAFYLYYFLEQLSYGCGVLWGCARVKNFSSYRLDLSKA